MKFISFVDNLPIRHEPFELHTYRPRTLREWWRGDKPKIIHTEYFKGRTIFSDIIIEPELELIFLGQKIFKFETDEYIFYGLVPVSFECGRFTCKVDFIESK